jgi:hypothetical protein
MKSQIATEELKDVASDWHERAEEFIEDEDYAAAYTCLESEIECLKEIVDLHEDRLFDSEKIEDILNLSRTIVDFSVPLVEPVIAPSVLDESKNVLLIAVDSLQSIKSGFSINEKDVEFHFSSVDQIDEIIFLLNKIKNSKEM